MKIKVQLSFLLALCGLMFTYAQSVVNGTVVGDDGLPIPGVTVIVQGTTNGTTSDFDGNFTINVEENQTLEISYVGYVSQQILFDGQDNLAITLAQDLTELDEIVVTGYGSRKKSHLTGAIAKLEGDDVAAIQATRADDALAGKLSGVLIQNQNGEPGADPKIQIRAASSISGDSNPLVVVDGYPISGSLVTVNPADIQSIEILKDASSAAIYGSRGANGVILVTTKKGKSGKASFSYNGYLSTSSKYVDNILMSGPEWAAHAREEIAAGNWDLTQIDPDFVDWRLSAYEDSPGAISPEDWLFRNGSTMNHDFSMSGGTDDVNYYASLGY